MSDDGQKQVQDDEQDAGSGGLPHDDALQALYRALPPVEPRAAIDEKILEAARKAAPRRASRAPRVVRWAVPLAAAAGVMLTIAITRLAPEQRASEVHEVALDDRARAVDALGDRSEAVEVDEKREADVAAKRSAAEPATDAAAPAPASPSPRARAAETARPAEPDAFAKAPPPAPAPAAESSDRARTEAGAAAESRERPMGRSDSRLAAGASPDAADRISTDTVWPFGLSPGMDAGEACREAARVLDVACSLRGGAASMTLAPARTVDRGPFAGRRVNRVVLLTADGILDGVDLWLVGASDDAGDGSRGADGRETAGNGGNGMVRLRREPAAR